MAFRPVSPSVKFPELDEELLAFWEREKIFDKTLEIPADKLGPNGEDLREPFIFYEGPPTANGMPHAGHVLTRVMKDVFLRYRSMSGYYVPRRGGWDTHGLPVEVEVEKALGISGREAIEAYGVEDFSRQCIDSVFRYIEEWRKMTRRIGFWVDLDAAYVTFHKTYVESVWWALKNLFDQGLLYQGYKVIWWWPQGGTALSAGEVGQGYQEVDDPSVMVRFGVEGEDKTSFLAWTTTPWTLPSNVALAVGAKLDYVTAQLEDGERLILAEALLEKVLGDAPHEIVARHKGADLVGKRYVSPFSYATPTDGRAHEVVEADFVSLESGSGLVHLAPAFGEDDYRVCQERGMGFLQLLKPDGTFPEEVTDFAGRFCKEADKDIIRDLKARGLLFKQETYRHEYPFCWRKMSDPLIQYARRGWFIRTTQEIHRVQENNQQVNWEPNHIKDGRFGQFLAGNVDWALSRERFWGTPLPVWINDESGKMECADSVEAILAKNPNAFDHFTAAREADPTLQDHLMVHKPWIDQVTWQNEGEAGTYRRVPEVIDCWFDSGCMPFAQWGYPHQNQAEFERTFPADFITEAVDQTRGWFYSLMTISTLLFEDKATPHPFRNCVVLGLLTDEHGKKYSKSLKNYTDPMVLMERVGGDAVRWALYSATVPGQNTRFFDQAATDAVREFLLKIWNVYSFFTTYANIDDFQPGAGTAPSIAERSELDRYILAELDHTVGRVRDELDNYKSHLAARHLLSFVDTLSNWYVRRSRDRFWAPGLEQDKLDAHWTLYECLVTTAQLLAPFLPFVTEEIWQNLVVGHLPDAPASVHMSDYPAADEQAVDQELSEVMNLVRDLVSLGLQVRTQNVLKVRQPLSKAQLVLTLPQLRTPVASHVALIADELNVQEVAFVEDASAFVTYEVKPLFPRLGPRVGKAMPALKKALAATDGGAILQALDQDGKYVVDAGGTPVELTPDDVQVSLTAKEGFAAASGKAGVVILTTTLTPELIQDGHFREVLHHVQTVRKDLDLEYTARIEVALSGAETPLAAVRGREATLATEVLATQVTVGAAPADGMHVHRCTVSGDDLVIGVKLADA